MSKLFFDHLIVLEKVEIVIKKSASSKEEKEELWNLVDKIVTHKALGKVLGELPRVNHEEFLEIFHKCPHDEKYIFGYLKTKTGKDMETELRKELKEFDSEILEELKLQDEMFHELPSSKK